jgi:hypothetical protein
MKVEEVALRMTEWQVSHKHFPCGHLHLVDAGLEGVGLCHGADMGLSSAGFLQMSGFSAGTWCWLEGPRSDSLAWFRLASTFGSLSHPRLYGENVYFGKIAKTRRFVPLSPQFVAESSASHCRQPAAWT